MEECARAPSPLLHTNVTVKGVALYDDHIVFEKELESTNQPTQNL